MGCGGGYRGLFRAFDYYSSPRRGCSDDRYDRDIYYERDDTEEKIILIKKMFAEGIVSEEEYKILKNQVIERRISFEKLMNMRSDRLGKQKNTKTIDNKQQEKEANNSKINKLLETKEKILQVNDKLDSRIKELTSEKDKLKELSAAMINTNEGKTEEYINRRLNIEESIQNLEKRKVELRNEIENINKMIKKLETRELEQEALRLKEELSNMQIDLDG
ncbi:hypothetical protein R9X47_07000 [Wukongibacter baidiensis]|uniref:hypothetical protein n=1 Tax=Wukongibacter baidiensis TaxID=1723361 RepID=UPI003D7F7240